MQSTHFCKEKALFTTKNLLNRTGAVQTLLMEALKRVKRQCPLATMDRILKASRQEERSSHAFQHRVSERSTLL